MNGDKGPETGKSSGKRRGLRILIAVCAGFAVIGATLSLPPVQRTILTAMLARFDRLTFEAGYFRIGPAGVEGRDITVRIARPNIRIAVDEIEIDLAYLSSLMNRRLDIVSAAVRGMKFDVALGGNREAGDRPPRRERPGFLNRGMRERIRAPEWIRVGELETDIVFALQTAGGLTVDGPLTLGGSSLAPGAQLEVRLAGTFDVARQGESLVYATIDARSLAHLNEASVIDDFSITLDVDPRDGRPGLRAEASADLLTREEAYTLDLFDAAGEALIDLSGMLTPREDFAVDWSVDIPPGTVAAFGVGPTLPDLTATSNGEIDYDVAVQDAVIRSVTFVEGSGWQVFSPRLAPLGALTLEADLDATLDQTHVTASRADLVLTSAVRGELFRVDALQPIRFDHGAWLVDPQIWGEPVLRVAAEGIPLSWIGSLGPAIRVRDGELTGVLELVRRAQESTELRVVEPIRALGVALDPVRGRELPPGDLVLIPHASFVDGEFEFDVERLALTTENGFELELDGRSRTSVDEWPLLRFDGNVSAHVPELQRLFPEVDRVRGSTELSFDLHELTMHVASVGLGADTIDGRALLAAEITGPEPLRIPLPQFRPDWDSFTVHEASLRFDRVPIDWLSPWVPELEFDDGALSGELIAEGGLGLGLQLVVEEPLRVEGFVPVYRGRRYPDSLDVRLSPRVAFTTARSSLAVEDFSIVTARRNSLNAEFALEATEGVQHLDFELDLAAEVEELAGRYGFGFGALTLRYAGELHPASRHFVVDELDLDVRGVDGRELLRFERMRPFELQANPFGIVVEDDDEILRATIRPLQLERIVPRAFELDIEGAVPEAVFMGRAGPAGELVLSTEEPLVFEDVSVRWHRAPLLDRLTAEAGYEVSYAATGLEVRDLNLRAFDETGDQLLHLTTQFASPLNHEYRIDRSLIGLEARLGALAQQPVLTDFLPFTDGTLAMTFEYNDMDPGIMAFNVSMSGAANAEAGDLPAFQAHLAAEGFGSDRVDFELPIRLESAESGTSDIDVVGSLGVTASDRLGLEAEISSQYFAARDLRRLLGVVRHRSNDELPEDHEALDVLSDESVSAIEKLRLRRDTTPVWTDYVDALASIDLARIDMGNFEIDNINARLHVSPEELALADLRADLLEADLSASARIGFDPDRPNPYALEMQADVERIELQKFYHRVTDSQLPTTEGHFRLVGTMTGEGRNPIDLGLSSRGDLRLTGDNGIFRGLYAHAGTGSTAARVIGALTLSRELRAVGRLIEDLGEIRFDRAEFELSRARADEISLNRLYVSSPEVVIDLSGTIDLLQDISLLHSPVEIDADIAVDGDLEILFDGMGLLEDETDAAGYRSLDRTVTITGTPVEPETAVFWDLLAEAAENSRGVFGAGLRALDRRLEARFREEE